MEKDDEIKGSGNSYDFGARMLDPRLGRWLTIDPQSMKQPDQSPYKAFYNNPLYWTDPNGETEYEVVIMVDKQNHTTTKMYVVKSDKIITDGKSVGKNLFGTKFYNYYSYSNVTKYVKAADGSTTVQTYREILYDRGVQKKSLGYGGKIIDPSDYPFKLAGGYYMTSSGDGGGADPTKYYSDDPDYVGDIGDLTGLLKTYSAGAELNIPKNLTKDSPGLEKLDKFMQVTTKLADYQENLDAIDDLLNVLKSDPDQTSGVQSSMKIGLGKTCVPDFDGSGCSHTDASDKQQANGDTLGGINPGTRRVNTCVTYDKVNKPNAKNN